MNRMEEIKITETSNISLTQSEIDNLLSNTKPEDFDPNKTKIVLNNSENIKEKYPTSNVSLTQEEVDMLENKNKYK